MSPNGNASLANLPGGGGGSGAGPGGSSTSSAGAGGLVKISYTAACTNSTLTLNPTGTDNQSLCVNTPLTDIVYVVSGSAASAMVAGLPNGVNGVFSGGSLTISGTPSQSGTFNYTVTTTGTPVPCTEDTTTGTITVNPAPNCAITGSSGPVCPQTNNAYTGPPSLSSYLWSISGNGGITAGAGTSSVTVTAGALCNNTYMLNLFVTNSNMCSSTCNRVVTVQDVAPPNISTGFIAGCFASQAAAEAAALAATSGTDNCGGAITKSVTTTGTCNAQITVAVKDACNNTANAIYFTRIDNVPPVVTTGSIASCYLTATAAEAAAIAATSATDNCAGPVNFSASTVGTCNAVVTVIATDGCGNQSTTTYNTKIDNTPPIITTGSISSCYASAAAAQAAAQAATSAIDNCSGGITFASSVTGTCNATVTVTATDACGNQSSTNYSTKIDNTPPVITTGTIGSCYPTNAAARNAALAATSAIDNCTGGITYNATVSGNCNAIVTVTATDACGNQSSTTYNTRVDNTSPTITSGSISSCYTTVGAAEAAAIAATSSADNCPGPVTFSASTSGSCNALITVFATDGCGNQASTTYATKIDNTPPVITKGSISSCYPTNAAAIAAAIAATSATDNCVGQVTFSGSVAGACNALVTVTATDACGNQSTTTYNTKIDNTAPSIFTGTIGSCFESVSAAQLAALAATTAVDNCGGQVIFGATTTGTCAATVTITATDDCGNQSSTSYSTRIDNTKPTITAGTILPCYTSRQLARAAAIAATSATDNCPGTVTFSAAFSGTNCNATYTVTATDDCGNQSSTSYSTRIYVNPPSGNGPSPSFYKCIGQVPAPDVNVILNETDDCGGAPSVTYVGQTSNGGTGCPSSPLVLTRTYRLTDCAGNATDLTEVITVNDDVLPTISCPIDQTITLTNSCTYSLGNFISMGNASDNCPGGVLVTQSAAPGTVYIGAQSIPVRLTAADACGRTANCTFNVVLIDNTSPTLTCPADVTLNTLQLNCSQTHRWTLPNALDNCGIQSLVGVANNGVVILSSPPTGSGEFPKGTTTVTYTATDFSGGTRTCSFSVRINDVELPVLTGCPVSVTAYTTTNSCNGIGNWVAPSASDNCPGVQLTSTHVPGTIFPKGNTQVTYIATDASSNSVSCSFIVTVADSTAPLLNCPANVTLNTALGVCAQTYTITDPVSDNCVGATWGASFSGNNNGNPTAFSGIADGNSSLPITFQRGSTTVTLNGVDASSNLAISCSFRVRVFDNEAPTLSCPQSITRNTAAGLCTRNYDIADPVSDNCPGASWNAAFSGNPNGNPTDLTGINDGNNSGNVTFQKGTTTIVLTATDGSNNTTASCTFTITVNDVAAPTLSCPTNVTLNTANGLCSQTYVLVDPVSDNCSGAVWNAAFSGNVNGNPNNLTGVADGTNSSALTFQKGVTTITYTATDASNNSAVSCAYSVTVIDNIAPVVTCPTSTTINTAQGLCSQTFAIVDPVSDNCPGATWSASFSGNPNGNPTNLNGIADGTNGGNITFQKGTTTVTYTAIDASGNSGSACQYTITVNDNIAPTLVCPSNVTLNTAQGLCTQTYNILDPVSDNCPNATWSASFSGNNNGNPANANGISDGSNSGTVTFEKGTTMVTLTATDASGNSATPCSFTVLVVDNIPPTVVCPTNVTLNTAQGLCSRNYNIQDPVTDNCPGATWGANFFGNANGVPTNFAGIADGSNSGGRTFQKGTTTVVLSATDASGNIAQNCTFTVLVVDNIAPIVVCPSNVTLNTAQGVCTQTYIILDPLTDNCPGASWGASFTGNNIGNPSNFSGIADGTNTAPITFQRGNTQVTLSAVDQSGNQATTCTFRVRVVDSEAPIIVCPANLTLNTAPGTCAATYTINDPISDNCSDATWNATFTGNANGTPGNLSGINDGSNSGLITFQKATTTILLTGIDASGNAAVECAFSITVVDNIVPTLVCPQNVNLNTAQRLCSQTYTINDPVSDNCPGATWGASFSGNANGIPGNLSGIADGSNSGPIVFQKGNTQVTLSAVDAAGNSAVTCTFRIRVTDNEAPRLSCPANVTLNTAQNQCSQVYNILDPVSDNCNAATWNASFSGNSNGNPSNLSGLADGTNSGNLTFQKGTTTVVLSATDASANTASSCTFSVIVIDNIPPVLSCPANLTINTAQGLCTQTYTLIDPVSDNCTGATWSASFSGNINGNPGNLTGIADGVNSSSTTFQKGATTIIYTATDASGNAASSCAFTVTVNDNIPPIVTCPASITLNTADRLCSQVYTILDPLSDNCNGAIWNANFSGNTNGNPSNLTGRPDGTNSGSITFQKGATTVILSGTDASGNIAANCTFVVTVVDNMAPTLVCPANLTLNMAEGVCTQTSVLADPVTDNCGGALWRASFAGNINGNPANISGIADGSNSSPITFQKGTTTVTYNATDAGGLNAASCSFTITVRDNQIPLARCKNVSLLLNNAGNAGTNATAVNNVSTDNCGILSISLSKTAFDCSDVGQNIVILTVSDVNGLSGSCTAVVSVGYTQRPVAICRNASVTLSNAGVATVNPSAVNNNSTDLCLSRGLTLALSKSTFDCSNLGPNTVTLTVTNIGGNSSTCTAVVTVRDQIRPTARCKPSVIVPVPAGTTVTIDASILSNGSSDNCNQVPLKFSASPNTFKCPSSGPNIVTLTVTDQSGNVSTCISIVSIDCNNGPGNIKVDEKDAFADYTDLLEIFPNPASDQVNIQMHGLSDGPRVVTILDYSGKVMYQKAVEAGESTLVIDLPENKFTSGIYMVSVKVSDRIQTKQLVLFK